MAKHKYIKTPEDLWGYWEKYKDWAAKNPIKVQDFVGKDGQEVWRIKQRPLTIERFELWVAENIGVTIRHYLDNPEGSYDKYRGIISRIRSERYADNIEGGMAGIYHPNLTARLNGVSEKIVQENITHNITLGS